MIVSQHCIIRNTQPLLAKLHLLNVYESPRYSDDYEEEPVADAAKKRQKCKDAGDHQTTAQGPPRVVGGCPRIAIFQPTHAGPETAKSSPMGPKRGANLENLR